MIVSALELTLIRITAKKDKDVKDMLKTLSPIGLFGQTNRRTTQ